MKFFAIKNHVSIATTVLEKPWEHKFTYPELLLTKDAWRQWSRDPNTEHCYISCVEGMAASVRIGDDNPVFQLHGLQVDYDDPWSPDDLEKLKTKKQAEHGPQYISSTFSGHARATYAFEAPVLLAGAKHHKAFVRLLAKKLKLHKLLLGFEATALEDPAKYYDIGKQWHPVFPDKCIPSTTLSLWAYEAAKGLSLAPAEYKVPMDKVAEEVMRRWPNRWDGEFKEGQRGLRFWDPQADNKTAAIVTAEGMLCFTGNQAFVTWREIFGATFVDKFEANKIESVLEHTWYDGRQFWFRDADQNDLWLERSKDDFDQKLRVLKFDPVRQRGRTCSEVDEVEYAIKERRRVDAAAPFIYLPPGRFSYNNKNFLNISRVKCMEPMPEAFGKPNPSFEDLQEHCGRLLYPFLCGFLDPIDDRAQLWHLLAWMKYFYVHSYRREPQQGQALAIGGDGSTGKTFFVQAILTPLMGGRARADDFLSGKSKWSADLAGSPIMSVDDSEGAGPDPRDLVAMTQRLKSIIANGELLYAAKFGAEITISWKGRIYLGFNLEEHSIGRSLPDITLSAYNKIMLLLTVSKENKFQGFCKTHEENQAILAEELPYFARWLLNWQPPKRTEEVDETRFGVRAYHHPELLKKAAHGHNDSIVWDAILNMMQARAENFKTMGVAPDSVYQVNLGRLHADLAATNPGLMRDLRTQSLHKCLFSLRDKGKPIVHDVHPVTGQEMWTIK